MGSVCVCVCIYLLSSLDGDIVECDRCGISVHEGKNFSKLISHAKNTLHSSF